MLAGSPTQHSDPPRLSSAAECLLSSPWPPCSTGASETLLQGQGKQPCTVSWRAQSSCWKRQQPRAPAQSALQRHDCGLRLSHGHGAKCHCGFACPPWHADSGPWAVWAATPWWVSGITVPKKQICLRIIPELFNLVRFYGTLRDFYF